MKPSQIITVSVNTSTDTVYTRGFGHGSEVRVYSIRAFERLYGCQQPVGIMFFNISRNLSSEKWRVSIQGKSTGDGALKRCHQIDPVSKETVMNFWF